MTCTHDTSSACTCPSAAEDLFSPGHGHPAGVYFLGQPYRCDGRAAAAELAEEFLLQEEHLLEVEVEEELQLKKKKEKEEQMH